MQQLAANRTTWHITWGTYGARLHGGFRATVDRNNNKRGQPFVEENTQRENYEIKIMRGPSVYLDYEQRLFAEETIINLCKRGEWQLRTCAAGIDGDHIHVLLDIDREVHGEKVRRLLKRWLTQALNERFGKPPKNGKWWAVQGSNKVVDTVEYLNRAYPYIEKQRTTK